MEFAAESAELRNSNWPKCDQLAAKLASRGTRALPALEDALRSKTKHVRSAVLKEILAVDPNRARALAGEFLKDKAYEVREAAAGILGIAVP